MSRGSDSSAPGSFSGHLPQAPLSLVAIQSPHWAGAEEREVKAGGGPEGLQSGSCQPRKVSEREGSRAQANPLGVVEGGTFPGGGPGARKVK